MEKILVYLLGLLLLQCPVVVTAALALTSEGGVADFPDYRIDSGGRIHLVWYDDSVDSGAIFYKLLNGSGNDLIPALQVNTGGSGSPNSWPAMSLDARGLVYVVWQDEADGEVWIMRLNPANAPLDGSPTTTADIREYEIRLSVDGGTNAVHPRMRIDANGDLHVVWESNGGDVEYAKVNPVDGLPLNGPLSLGIVANGTGLPDVDVDTAGHAHIVFSSNDGTATDELYYAMVDGDPAAVPNVRIDPTRLSGDDGLRAGSATVNVDRFDNTLYMVFKQALANGVNGVEEVFLARLNPSLDAQDGGAANPAALKLFEKRVTSGQGLYQWHVTSRIASDKRIHATYIDFDQGGCPGAGVYSINDSHITFAGDVVISDLLTTTGSATSCFPQVRTAPGSSRIVWPDSTTPGISEVMSSSISRADTGESGYFTCSLTNRDGVAWRSGELWLLLGLVLLLGVRRLRRNH
ncbi:MAG: hypothetical protein WBO34_01530 [Gammaproteobacteria bacterium]